MKRQQFSLLLLLVMVLLSGCATPTSSNLYFYKQALEVYELSKKLNLKVFVNIGDQESNLAGGYAERAYKLPNPFYFTP